MTRTITGALFWIALLSLSSLVVQSNSQSTSTSTSSSHTTSGHPLKLEQDCFPHLLTAANQSDPKDYLHEDEYVTFLQAICASDTTIPSDLCTHILRYQSQEDVFSNLESLFIFTYNSLQCNYWCSVFYNGAKSCKCTNEGIPIHGARQGDDLNMKERQYLYEVCDESYHALHQVLGEYVYEPTPLPSVEPTSAPTYDPFNNPIITATAPFGLANVWDPPLRAEDIAMDRDNIKTDLELVLENLTLDVLDSDIFVKFNNGDGKGGKRKRQRQRQRQLLRSSSKSLGQILKQQNGTGGGGGEGAKRRLEISFERSYITNIKNVECPNSIKVQYNNEATCQHMDGKVQIKVLNPELREPVRTAIEEELLAALNSDKFYKTLPPNQRENISIFGLIGKSAIISMGAIIAISSGAAVMGLFAGRALVLRRKADRRGDGEGYASNFPISPLADSSFGSAEDVSIDKLPPTRQISADSVGGSSSNAGSSGWSSSAGISSMNSESVGSGDYYGTSMAAITAASALHQQKFNKNSPKDNNNNGTTYHIPAVEESSVGEDESDFETNLKILQNQRANSESKLDLNNAIQAGNWAAVGATAAILASAVDSRSTSSGISSGVGSLSGFSGLSSGLSSQGGNSIHSERAAELDQLVEAGDWEGVVLAAAKFEAEPEKLNDSGSAGGSEVRSGRSTADRSHAASSTTGMSASYSESQSNNVKRAEIRAEVEALVRRVVPDEIDNVDEMMNQFRGREEELLETLRSMQERAIAQRNREASRRNAKREARKVAKKAGGVSGLPPRGRMAMGATVPGAQKMKEAGDLDSTFSEADFSGRPGIASNSLNDTLSLPSSNLSTSQTASRAELENAINDGNWQAVGETAARLGAASVSSGGTSEFLSAGEESDYASVRSQLSKSDMSTSSRSERALQLESLIDQEDWTGVVNAANNYNATDAKSDANSEKEGSDSSNDSKKWKLPFRRGKANPETTELMSDTKKANKEEEEALAQAQIWEAVAAQSKASSEAKGASDAADWAISRSLRQIEQSSSKSNKNYTSDSEATNSVNDDDKSV